MHEIYPETTEQASRQVILINSVEILDKLRSSQFNKLGKLNVSLLDRVCRILNEIYSIMFTAYLYTTPNRPRQTHANMVMIKAAHIRPDPQLVIEECCLKISLLPFRLNVDQDALLFIYQYFSDLNVKSDSEGVCYFLKIEESNLRRIIFSDEDSISGGRFTNPPSHTPSCESLPVMTVGDSASGTVNMEDDSSSNLLIFNEDPFGMDDNVSTCSKDPSIDSNKSSTPIYFRSVIANMLMAIIHLQSLKNVDHIAHIYLFVCISCLRV